MKNEPYRFDVLGGKAPVALGVKVAEIKEFFLARFYAGESAGDFPGNECLAAAGRFVVEKNSVAGEEIVAFAVVAGHPVGVNLSGGVGAPGMEGRGFALRRRSGSERFTARGLVEASGDARAAESLEDAGRSEARDVARVFGEIEAHPDVALNAEMVDLVGFDVVDQVGQLFGIRESPVMEEEADIRQVCILVEMVDPGPVETARTADNAMDLIAFEEKKVSKI